MRSRNCEKGYSCGASCISLLKSCRVSFTDGVSVTLEERAILKSYDISENIATKEEGYRVKDSDTVIPVPEYLKGDVTAPDLPYDIVGDRVVYQLEAGGNRNGLEVARKITPGAAEYLKENWNGQQVEVVWVVKGRSPEGMSPQEARREKLRIALEAKKMWEREILPQLPEGMLIYNNPLGGKDGVRDRLYQKGGFGRVGGDGYQYALVKKGKLVPVELTP